MRKYEEINKRFLDGKTDSEKLEWVLERINKVREDSMKRSSAKILLYEKKMNYWREKCIDLEKEIKTYKNILSELKVSK